MKKLLLALVFLAGAAQAETRTVCTAIAPDTSAYAAGDIVGGKLTFANILHDGINAGLIQNVSVTNTEVDGIGYTLCLFNADPTASTVADQGALAVPAADLQKWKGCIAISTSYALAATETYVADNIGKAINSSGTSLYAVLRTVGAPTWAAAQTVNVCITVMQDS